MIEKDIIFV